MKTKKPYKATPKLTIFDCTIRSFGSLFHSFCQIYYIDAGLIAQSTNTHIHSKQKACGQYFSRCSFVFFFFWLFWSLHFSSFSLCVLYRLQFNLCNIFAILIQILLLFFISFNVVENNSIPAVVALLLGLSSICSLDQSFN